MTMGVTTVKNDPGTCELCGTTFGSGARERIRHLRQEHPAYARGLLLRVGAPAVFLIELLVMAAVHAPQWVFIVALFSSFAMLFFGKQWSRSARRDAGVRPVLPFTRTLREGGYIFLMIVPIVALIIALAGRH